MKNTIKWLLISLEVLSALAGLVILVTYPIYCKWALIPYSFILLNLTSKLIIYRIQRKIEINKLAKEMLKD